MREEERINIRIDAETKKRLEEKAREQNRTVSNFIKTLIKKEIEK